MLTPTHAPATRARRIPVARLMRDLRPLPPLYMHDPEPLAALYAAASPEITPAATAAWRALADHAVLHAAVLRATSLSVTETTDASPYADAVAMFADMDRGRMLVSTANCEHPLWTPAENVAFRVVHDHCHWLTGGGFDWRGEQQACAAHAQMLTAAARRALWTECLGQTAHAIARGAFAAQKATLLPTVADAPRWAAAALAGERHAH